MYTAFHEQQPLYMSIIACALLSITLLSGSWLSRTADIVTEPYLDEVFHVGQAHRYCAGNFHEWDSKITTPPGLYLLSYLIYRLTGRCDLRALRALNVAAIAGVLAVSFDILQELWHIKHQGVEREHDPRETPISVVLAHVHAAFNIALFPPLFFFSGLYYTDIASTLWVLHSYKYFLQSQRKSWSRVHSTLWMVTMGIAALLFRQTNIFWIAVFPAGLSVLQALKKTSLPLIERNVGGADMLPIIKSSWTDSFLYDVPVKDAAFEDFLKTVLSISVVAISRLYVIPLAILPYIILLGLFGGFVAWNGGVVLGDKSNHVATIHLPQMLYIWPYILFFSFPLIMPTLLAPLVSKLPQHPFVDRIRQHLTPRSEHSFPRISLFVSATALAALTIHFNTIFHPFTLADNRHYVFYVLRILRLHPVLRYFAAPTYILSGWAIIATMGVSHAKEAAQADRQGAATGSARAQKRPAMPPSQRDYLAGERDCQASFVLVWLATTALSVVTAPLVEPRYFIIPWVMWRLHISASGWADKDKPEEKSRTEPLTQWSDGQRKGVISALRGGLAADLAAETAWLLLVNFVTGYVFLYRGFAWPQEPGRVQRFMW